MGANLIIVVFAIFALSLESLMELTVVGASKYQQKQSEVAAAVSVITRREIRAQGWRTLGEALGSLPGVYTTSDHLYTYVAARGFGLPGDTITRLLFTINGNRANDPVYDGGVSGRELPLDLDLVERIEFIPGPGGAVYGQNAMFGVINIITRSGSEMGGTELALGAQQPQRLREGRISHGQRLENGLDVLLSASYIRAGGEDKFFDYGASGVSGVATGQDAERLGQIFARVAGGAWSAEVTHGTRRKEDPTASYFSDPLTPGQFTRDTYSLAQLQYEGSFAEDTLKLTGRLFAGRYRFVQPLYYEGELSVSTAQGDWRGTELRLLSTAVTDHKLMLGLETQDNVHVDQGQLYPAYPDEDVRIPKSGYRIGVYAQDEWRITPAVSTTLGLRIDRNDATGTATSPRAALIWQATADTTVKALYGRAHRAPNVYEHDFADTAWKANPSLKGESIDTLELVADHVVGSDLKLRGSIYQWTMRDIIVLGTEAVSGLPQFQSGPKVNARGLEISADKTWAVGARLRGSVALQDAAYESGASLPNSPKLLAKLNLSAPLTWAGIQVGYELRFSSQRLNLDGSALGGFAVSNLHLSTEALAKGLELSANVSNLFAKRYSQPLDDSGWQKDIAQNGRSVRVQANYRF